MMKVAIIGGTGYEKPDQLKPYKSQSIKTPYGPPVTEIYSGQIDGLGVLYMPRFGKNIDKNDSYDNCMANLYALKDLGCHAVFSTSECASLQEEICPGEFIIPDQFIDMTKGITAGMNNGIKSNHLSRSQMANPFSEELRDHLTESAIIQGITVHNKGTVVTINSGRYLTKAESKLFRTLGGDIIDQTTSPEVLAANELGLPYAQVLFCTEYDTWRVSEGEETVAPNLEILDKGYKEILQILSYCIKKIQEEE